MSVTRRASAPAFKGGAVAPAIAGRVQFYPRPHVAVAPVIPREDDRESHYQILIEQAADAILTTDASGRIRLANSRASALTGYGGDEIVGLDLLATYVPEERELGRERMVRLPAGTAIRFERDLLRKDGSRVPIEVSVAWLPNGERQSIFHDVSARRRAEDELRALAASLEASVEERTHELEQANIELAAANRELQELLREQERLQAELAFRAMHDPLTGLANRTMFGERLTHALRVSDRGVAVVWIDLDRFKEINDIFGHLVGDEMLVAVADRLREIVRESDDVARMGGDEFGIVLPNVVESEARMVCDRVLVALNDASAFRLQMGASVGVAWQPPFAGNGPELIRRADEAMYRAKTSGGGRAVMY